MDQQGESRKQESVLIYLIDLEWEDSQNKIKFFSTIYYIPILCYRHNFFLTNPSLTPMSPVIVFVSMKFILLTFDFGCSQPIWG